MPDPSGRAPEPSVARPAADPAEQGWGSPVPAEYGSLRVPRPARAPATAVRAQPEPSAASAASSAVATAASNAASSVVSLLRKIQGDGKTKEAPTNGSGYGRGVGNGRAARNGWAGRLTGGVANGSAATATPARQATSNRTGAPTSRGPSPAPARTTGTPAARVGSAPAPAPASGRAGAPVLPPSGAPVDRLDRRNLRDAIPRPTRREERAEAARQAQLSRSRVTVRHIDIWTVIRVSVIFYLVAAVVVVAASLLLWYAADAFGTLPSIEKSIRTLFGLKSFKIHAGAVAGYMTLAGLVLTVAGAIANVLAALIYNLISDVVGGIRVELEAPRRRRRAP